MAPMNTAPAEIAASVVAIGPINATGSPPARLKNTRYVGALSRKLESAPVNQKYRASIGAPLELETAASSGASTPALPALRIAIAGMMVRKIAAKSLATSMIGPHSK